MKKKSLSRIHLLAIFAVFFAPLLFAVWLYFSSNSWLTSQSQNHGVLILPPRPLNDFSLESFTNTTWTQEAFLGNWTILYLGDSRCDLYCEASLFKMRQVHLSLGRDSQRVQRKYFGVENKIVANSLEDIFANYPNMQKDWFDHSLFRIHLPQFKDLDMYHIYLVDPLGNLMMCYPKSATAKGMKKDLKRLLKVSRIG